MLGQTVGFPVPEGGAGRAHRGAGPPARPRWAARSGATPRSPRIEVTRRPGDRRADRATASGSPRGGPWSPTWPPPRLYGRLLAAEDVPAPTCGGMKRFQLDPAHGQGRLGARRTGAVGGEPGVRARHRPRRRLRRSRSEALAQVAAGVVPARPFLLAGQMTTTDPTRSPAGTESMWAYTHVPQQRGATTGTAASAASGTPRTANGSPTGCSTGSRPRARLRLPGPGPPRPRPARARGAQRQPGRRCDQRRHRSCTRSWSSGRSPARAARRPAIAGLYLGSSSAHPGGGVHGAAGMNAARAALFHDRLPRLRRTPQPQETR